jgi:hypothetical protein
MTVGELANDRAELLQTQRRPATRKDCEERLRKVQHARRKFGSACEIPIGLEELLEGWLAEFPPVDVVEPLLPPARVVVETPPPRPVVDTNPIEWLPKAVLIGVTGHLRVLGFDSAKGAPRWLADHIVAKGWTTTRTAPLRGSGSAQEANIRSGARRGLPRASQRQTGGRYEPRSPSQ